MQFTVYENVKYLGNQNNPYHAAIEPKNDNLSSFVLHENTKIIASTTFSDCSRLSSIEIPDSVTSIGERAFYRCSSLTSVVIPDSVTSIGDEVFYNCSSLTNITFKGTVAEWYAIKKASSWNYTVPAMEVVCLDGKVSL